MEDYLKVVPNPMCLADVRDKIASGQYSNANALRSVPRTLRSGGKGQPLIPQDLFRWADVLGLQEGPALDHG